MDNKADTDFMGSRTDWQVLLNAMLSGFLAGVATRIFVISMPTLATNLGTDIGGISWALVAYPFATVGLSLVFGRVGDLYGRQTVFRVGFAIFTMGSLLCGFSENVFQLILFRLIQGTGAAMTQSQARALAMEAVPENSAGKAQGLMTVAHQAGFLFGPGLGGLIIDYLHWRGVFFVLVPIGTAGSLLTWADRKNVNIAKNSRKKTLRSSIDFPGITYLIGTTVLLMAVLDRQVIEAIPIGWELVLIVALIGMFLCFVARERTASSPILELSLFKNRMFTMSTTSLLLVSVTHSMTSFMLPFYLQGVLSLTPSLIGLVYLSPPVFIMLFSPLGGYLSDRIGPTVPATIGVALATAAYLFGASLRADSDWLLPVFMLSLAGIGDGLFSSSNHTAMISSVPRAHRGVATGALQMMFGLGNIFGVSLASFLITTAFNYYNKGEPAIPSTSNTFVFVAALNVVFLVITSISAAATFVSAIRGTLDRSMDRPNNVVSPERRLGQ